MINTSQNGGFRKQTKLEREYFIEIIFWINERLVSDAFAHRTQDTSADLVVD